MLAEKYVNVILMPVINYGKFDMLFADMDISIIHFTGAKYCVKILTGAKKVGITIP